MLSRGLSFCKPQWPPEETQQCPYWKHCSGCCLCLVALESPSDSILQLQEGYLPVQVRPFQAQVFLVIFLIQLQWSLAHQPHRSATSLLVWKFLAALTSQVHVSKALRRCSSGWEDNTGGKQRVSPGHKTNVCSSSPRAKQSSWYSQTCTAGSLLEEHHIPVHQMSSAVLTKEGSASKGDRLRPQISAAR